MKQIGRVKFTNIQYVTFWFYKFLNLDQSVTLMLPTCHPCLKTRPDHNQKNDFRERYSVNPVACRAMTFTTATNSSLHLAIGCDIKNALVRSGIETHPGPTRQEVIDGARRKRVFNFSLNPKYYPQTIQDDDNYNGSSSTFSYCTNCLWKGIPRVKNLCPRCGRFNQIRPAKEDDEEGTLKVIAPPSDTLTELKGKRVPAMRKTVQTPQVPHQAVDVELAPTNWDVGVLWHDPVCSPTLSGKLNCRGGPLAKPGVVGSIRYGQRRKMMTKEP